MFLRKKPSVKTNLNLDFRIFPCVDLCPTDTFLVSVMPKHVRMISVSPSSNLTVVEERQVVYALFRQGPSAGSNGMCPTTPSSGSYQHTPTSTSVKCPPTPLSPSTSTRQARVFIYLYDHHTINRQGLGDLGDASQLWYVQHR